MSTIMGLFISYVCEIFVIFDLPFLKFVNRGENQPIYRRQMVFGFLLGEWLTTKDLFMSFGTILWNDITIIWDEN